MNANASHTLLRALALASIPAAFACTDAHARAPLTIPWYTIDGGGGRSTTSTLRLTGTIGQPDATRRAALTAGTLTLTGGFWALTTTTPCLGDYNSDTSIDVLDFLDFIDDFSTCDQQPGPCGTLGDADFNGDTFVDVIDFLDFIDAFATGC